LVSAGAKVLLADAVLKTNRQNRRRHYILTILLSDGSSFRVEPFAEAISDPLDENDEVADWEIFTPYDRCIAVGPGEKWAYQKTDVVMQC